MVAAFQLSFLPEETFVQQCQERFDVVASRVIDHMLKAQQHNADKQARILATCRLVGEEIATWKRCLSH